MNCPACQTDILDDAQYCTECGAPAPPPLRRRPPSLAERAADWANDRRSLVMAAAAALGLVLVAGAALVLPQQQAARAASVDYERLLASYSPGEPTGPLEELSERLPRPAPAEPARGGVLAGSGSEAAEAAPPAPAVPMAAAAAPPASLSLPEPEPDLAQPLPPDFEFDPRWSFAPPPRVARRPVKKADPIVEPTPPSHTLAMDPNTPRGGFVMMVPQRGNVEGVAAASAPAGQRLPSLKED